MPSSNVCFDRLNAVLALGALCVFAAGSPTPVYAADPAAECFSEDLSRRVPACTALIENGMRSGQDLADAYAARALAHSVQARYELAIADYDASIAIDPNSPISLNNRAWAYFKSGQPERGSTDVEKALALLPDSPHTLDTRAHILQWRGDHGKAMRDYESAMRFGGEHIVKLYQCGLQANSLFSGEIDGLYTSDMRKAFEACIATTGCDPLPADEECRKVTS